MELSSNKYGSNACPEGGTRDDGIQQTAISGRADVHVWPEIADHSLFQKTAESFNRCL